MEVGDEDQRGRAERDEGRERRHLLVRIDLDAERVGETEQGSRRRRPASPAPRRTTAPERRSARRSSRSQTRMTRHDDRIRRCAAPRLASSIGASASVPPTATNRRICMGICAPLSPGAIIRQAPTRQNSRKVANTRVVRPLIARASGHHAERAHFDAARDLELRQHRQGREHALDDHAHEGPRLGRRDHARTCASPRAACGSPPRPGSRTPPSGADRCRTRRPRPWRRASGSGGTRCPSDCRAAAP